MEISRRTWIAAVKLAVVVSTLAALAAMAVASLGTIPDAAIIGGVAVIAFAASWVQTGRISNAQRTAAVVIAAR